MLLPSYLLLVFDAEQGVLAAKVEPSLAVTVDVSDAPGVFKIHVILLEKWQRRGERVERVKPRSTLSHDAKVPYLTLSLGASF